MCMVHGYHRVCCALFNYHITEISTIVIIIISNLKMSTTG